jgi:hypothetical protein
MISITFKNIWLTLQQEQKKKKIYNKYHPNQRKLAFSLKSKMNEESTGRSVTLNMKQQRNQLTNGCARNESNRVIFFKQDNDKY